MISDEYYEYLRAEVDMADDGTLTWIYKIRSSKVVGRMSYEESVSEWTDAEIIDLTCDMLDVDDDQRHLVQVVWL